jgi:predicted transposase YdaD
MEEIKQLNRKELDQILKLPNSWVEKGKKEGMRETALNLLKEGLSIELIARATNLDSAEIEEIRKQLSKKCLAPSNFLEGA